MCLRHIDVRAVESYLNKPAGVFFAPPVRRYSVYLKDLYKKAKPFINNLKSIAKPRKICYNTGISSVSSTSIGVYVSSAHRCQGC